MNRKQFGKSIVYFARVSDKLAASLCDFIAGREVSYAPERARDSGKRCDIEVGMAKLLGARATWSNADASLEIHGGNGYALKYEPDRCRTVSWQISIPRSARRSSTFRRLNGKRTYIITTNRIMSGDELK